MSLEHAKLVDKSNVLKPKIANAFFKFGKKKWGGEGRVEESQLYELEHGVNKIYRKKENEKKYLLPYQIGDRRPEKLSTVVGNKTNISFKISQKRREKSTYLMNI